MSMGAASAVRGEFPTSREVGEFLLLVFPRTIEWLQATDIAMTGVDKG